jgi:hypothetical protein
MISNVQRAPTISSVRATGQDASRLFFTISGSTTWFVANDRGKMCLAKI